MKINSIQPVNVAIKVKKQSESGIYQNQRLLLMRSGYLSYFSKVPNLFDGNIRSLEHSGELPKMTLSASDVSVIKKDKKYLYLKFNKKHLINKKKLQKIINQDKRDGVGLTQNDQNIQWIFKCQTIDQAETFLQQILIYKKNPNLKPQLSKFIQGYREGKKGFRPQSLATSPSSNNLTASHRFSEQTQQIVKNFRSTSIHEMPFKNNQQISNQKNQIKQQEIQEQNQIQPIKQQKIENSTQDINIEHSEQVKQATTPLNSSKHQQKPKINNTVKSIRPKEQPSNSYSKQTFPYFPFVKNKKSTKNQVLQLYHIQNSKSDKQLLKKLSQKQFKKKEELANKKQKNNLDLLKNKRSATLGNKNLIKKQQSQKRIQLLKRNTGQNGNPSWSQLKQLKRAISLFSSLKNQGQQNQIKQVETFPYQNKNIQCKNVQQNLQNKNSINLKQPAQQQTCFILQQKAPQNNQHKIIQISNIKQDQKTKQNNEVEHCQKQTNEIIQQQNRQSISIQQNIVIQIQKTKQATQDKETQNQIDSQKKIKIILQTETMNKQQEIQYIAQALEDKISRQTVKIQPQIIQLDTQSIKQIKEQKIKNILEQEQQQKIKNNIPQTQKQQELQNKLEYQPIKQQQQIQQIKRLIVQNKFEEQIKLQNNADKQKQQPLKKQAFQRNNNEDIKQAYTKITEQKKKQQITILHQQLLHNQINTQVKQIVHNKIQQKTQKFETYINHIIQNQNQITDYKIVQSRVVNQPSQPSKQQSNKQLVQVYQLIFQQSPSKHQEQPQQNIIQQQQQLFKQQTSKPKNKHKQLVIQNLETVFQQQKESENDDHVQTQVTKMHKSKKQKDTIKYFWNKPKQDQDHDQKQKINNQRKILAFQKKQSIQKQRELSHKRDQQMKQKQIELQNIEVKNYAKQLLTLKEAQEIGDTFRKIIKVRRKYTLCPQVIPEAIAKQLLWIKKNNGIKKLAINLMIKHTKPNKLTNNIDCESIFFGPRQKDQGWQLFVYQQQAVYKNIFNFYCQLQKQIQNGAFNYGVRVAKFIGLMFRGYYGIFVQSVENSYKNIPNSITNIVNKVLQATFLTNMQVQIKIEVDAYTNQFIIWVNPSYLSYFNILTKKYNYNKNNDKIQSISTWVKEQSKETLFLIDQQIGQVSHNNNTIQILKQISNYSKLGIKYTTNTEIQLQTIFIIQQNNTIIKQGNGIINKLKYSIVQYLNRKQFEKAAQIIFWCGLKVLALSQIQNYISIYMIELLQVLKITIELFIQEQKYAQAAQICRYNLQLLLGFSNIQQFNPQKLQNLIKIKLILILQNEQKILKFFQTVCSSMLYLLISCTNKQKSNYQNITKIFEKSLNIINCLQAWTVKQYQNNQLVNKAFLDSHAYYCMLFNYFYASFCYESCSQILKNQAFGFKQASYKFAYVLLSSDDLANNQAQSEHIETAQKIALNFIDLTNQIKMYETANRTIEKISKLKITELHSKFGRNLDCRKSISLCFSDHAEISYQILLSHLLYCFQKKKNNIRPYFSKVGSNNQLAIHQIIITYCKIFAYNDDKLFVCLYQVLNNIAEPQFYLSSLKEGLNELEPEVKKRVIKKLSL